MQAAEEFAPGVWVTTVALGEYDVRGALVVGERRALVWDTLSHPRDMAAWRPLVGSRELVVAYSHADWDHVWGTAGLPHDTAVVVSQDACAARFEADVPQTLAAKRREHPGTWDEVRLVPPGETFLHDLTLDLGGLTVNLHHLPGHTADCIVGLVHERGILLAGDTVETPCPVVPPDSPLTAWIAELRRWERDERVRAVVPAHGRVGGPEVIVETLGYLEALAGGCPIEPRGELTPFYAATHRANLAWRGPGSASAPSA
jgi:glyoxylase-like metal-dependent hydrolase (beta-lactamase superfamily II)